MYWKASMVCTDDDFDTIRINKIKMYFGIIMCEFWVLMFNGKMKYIDPVKGILCNY